MRPQPPLDWIESCLFPSNIEPAAEPLAPALGAADTAGPDTLPEDGWSAEQLGHLLTLARRVPLAVSGPNDIDPGQIRRLQLHPQPTRPVHMLISRQGPLFVHGWPVVPDVDYASDTDWVLQEEEMQQPLHPATALVQLWNPMLLPVGCLDASVNQLRPEAWQALQSVAGPLLSPHRGLISEPLAVVSVARLADHEFVTGAPLAPGARFEAERRAHRALWERWVEEMLRSHLPGAGRGSTASDPPRPIALTPPEITPVRPSPSGWRALALASVVALAMVIAQPLLQVDPEGTSDSRSVPANSAKTIIIEVHLAPEARLSDLSAWLAAWGGQLAGGPSESGAITIAVPAARQAQVLSTLGASPLVEKFDLRPKR